MIRTLVLSLAAVAAATSTAAAQLANPRAEGTSASVGLGFDHGAVLEAGVRRPVAAARGLWAHGHLQVPSVPGLGEGAITGGATLGRTRGAWGATASLAAVVRWVDGNLLWLAQGGTIATATAGHFRRRGGAAVELAWEHGLVTYAAPTDTYRMLIYADAHGGFHGGGGGTLRAGLTAGLAVGRGIGIAARAGYVVTEELNPVPGLPFYAVLGGSYAWQ